MLITYARLRERGIPFSRTHLARLERDGRFPRRVRISARRIGWLSDELDEFLQARAAERDQEQPHD
jgi:prophage regulatory protein